MSSSFPLADWSSRFQQLSDLAAKWKQTNLRAQLQGPIESDAARVSVERDHLLSGRKTLMQLTKEYSKLEDPSEKLVKLGPLIKAFQNHVDEANKCLKSVESARGNMHELVKGLEDPVPTLERFLRYKTEFETALNQTSREKQKEESSSEKVAVLEEKIADLTEELSELKNQEVTIAQLREQISEMELDTAHEKQQAATEMSNEVQEVLKSWQNREYSLRQENSALAAENRKLQKMYNDTSMQVSGIRQQLESVYAQREADAEKSADENQELQVQLALAKREIQTLSESVEGLKEKLKEYDDEENDDDFSSPSSGRRRRTNGSSSPSSPYFNSNSNNNDEVTPQNQIQHQQHRHESSSEQQQERDDVIAKLSEKLTTLEKEKSEALEQSRTRIEELESNLQQMRDWGTEVNKQYEKLKDLYDVARQDVHSLRRKYDAAVEEARDMRKQVLELESALSIKEVEQQQQQDATNNKSLRNNNENGILGGEENHQVTIISIPGERSSPVSTIVADAATDTNKKNNFSSSSSSSPAALLDAVVAQRDNLKKRLLNLEGASSREINQLQEELQNIKAERQGLLVEIAKLSGNLPSSRSQTPSDSSLPSSSSSLMNRHRRHSLTGGRSSSSSSNSNQQHQPPNVFDLFGNLVARFVNSSPGSRRIFVGYLLSVHLFFFLMLALDT